MNKLDFYEKFAKWQNGDIADAMCKCSHHYSPSVKNPWHMEDDVMTHTEMVFEQCGDDNSLFIAALCHDIGKLYTRNLNHEKRRASFFGHECASIQPTIDFSDYINIKENLKDTLFMVNNHMVFHKATPETLAGYCNYDKELFEKCAIFSLADSKGRISDVKDVRLVEFPSIVSMKASVEDADVIFTCGVPGSGKDYVAEKLFPNHKIVSFDDIRVHEYLKVFPKDASMADDALYEKAWNWCRKKIDLTKLAMNDIIRWHNMGYGVVLANTNCTIAARRQMLHAINTAKMTSSAIFVAVPSDIFKKRNQERSSRTVPEAAINRFSKELSVPTMNEGFIATDIILNF